MGRPLAYPLSCWMCSKRFESDETVMFVHGGSKSYTFREAHPVHLACANALSGSIPAQPPTHCR